MWSVFVPGVGEQIGAAGGSRSDAQVWNLYEASRRGAPNLATGAVADILTPTPVNKMGRQCEDSSRGFATLGEESIVEDLYEASRKGAVILTTGAESANLTPTPASICWRSCEDSSRGFITLGEESKVCDIYEASRKGAPIQATGAEADMLTPTPAGKIGSRCEESSRGLLLFDSLRGSGTLQKATAGGSDHTLQKAYYETMNLWSVFVPGVGGQIVAADCQNASNNDSNNDSIHETIHASNNGSNNDSNTDCNNDSNNDNNNDNNYDSNNLSNNDSNNDNNNDNNSDSI